MCSFWTLTETLAPAYQVHLPFSMSKCTQLILTVSSLLEKANHMDVT